MKAIPTTRRQFLKGCCATAAAGALGPRLLFGAQAHAQSAPTGDVVVSLFLRGGMDGLNLVVPIAGSDRAAYEAARPNLSIALSGAYAALPLSLADGTATGFGLHPSASGLRDLWQDGRLAIVHACGLATSASRSHFDAQLALEQGLARGLNSGWMARALDSQGVPSGVVMPALASMSRTPVSLSGTNRAITLDSTKDFALNSGPWVWQKTRPDSPAGLVGVAETLAQLWQGNTGLEMAGARADQSLRVIATQPYTAVPAGWPTSNVARQFWTILQSIRFGIGLRYAAIDLGGWDTHDGQGTAGAGYNYFQDKVAELSQALSAFQAELVASGLSGRVTTVVQSEFGRRFKSNSAGGTDHGYGGPMLVLGGAVNGRRFYGSWPGLASNVIAAANGDVPVTTDFRRVLQEILQRRMAHANVAAVFPGYTGYTPLGIVQGVPAAGATVASAGAAMSAAAAPVDHRAGPFDAAVQTLGEFFDRVFHPGNR